MRFYLLKSIITIADMLHAYNDIFVCSNVVHSRQHS